MFFFFKQKTAYEMEESDWSSDVCSSDLHARLQQDATLEKVLVSGGEHKGIRGVPLRGGDRVKWVQS